MANLRIAGYNVENLFTRPRVLNLEDSDAVASLLGKIAEFKRLLARKSYDGIEGRIVALSEELKDFVELNIRSRKDGIPRNFLNRKTLKRMGAADFVGFVEFKRDNLRGVQIENTAAVIKTIRPDILGLVEVENRLALQRFDEDVLGGYFRDLMVVDGNDPRGIDVAAAARKTAPILGVRTNVLARDADPGYVFSRDCLEIETRLGGKPLHILVNHFKAKDKQPRKSDRKRERQALEVRRILTKRYDLATEFVVVLGDLNDEPESNPLRPLISTPNLLNVWDIVDRPEDDRWTYYYGAEKAYNKIDMLLVSKGLAARVVNAGIERRGMANLAAITGGKEQSFKSINSWRDAASDHAAVWLDVQP